MKYSIIIVILLLVTADIVKVHHATEEKPNTSVIFTGATLDKGKNFSIKATPSAMTVTISSANSINVKELLPAILTLIVSNELEKKLKHNQYLDTYLNFYVDFGHSLSFEDLFGNHSDNQTNDFFKYLLVKFEAAAGTSFTGPMAKEFLETRTRLNKLMTSNELLGFYNGRYLKSFHEKARKIAAEVFSGKPEAKNVVAALTSVELAVGTAQIYIVKLLDILRRVGLM